MNLFDQAKVKANRQNHPDNERMKSQFGIVAKALG